ncbi:MAG TPA: PKD domain-containing protein, partial [Methanosarcina vacuolata]|nr:PKD domain-containing protein [Methanosarcina vacuolata]
PLRVVFTDLSVIQKAHSINGWEWNFGDGAVSTEQNPEHTYTAAGNYTVSLTARNDNGSSSACVVIQVLNQTNKSSAENTVIPEDAAYIVNPKDTGDSGSSHRNESRSAEEFLNRKSLEPVENFVMYFTGTRTLADVEPSVEYKILRLADSVKNFIEDSVSISAVRNISTHAMFFGFLGIALGLSVFRRGKYK